MEGQTPLKLFHVRRGIFSCCGFDAEELLLLRCGRINKESLKVALIPNGCDRHALVHITARYRLTGSMRQRGDVPKASGIALFGKGI